MRSFYLPYRMLFGKYCTSSANIVMIILLFVTVRANGQTKKSTFSLFSSLTQQDILKISPESNNKIKRIEGLDLYKQVLAVKIGDLAKIQKKGELSFAIPGSEQKFSFYAKRVNVASDSDFTWFGHSRDYLSTALFICKNGKLSGTFNLNNRHFQLATLEYDISILQEDKPAVGTFCGSIGTEYSSEPSISVPPKTEESQGARMGVCTEPVRVLVLYTQNAVNSVFSISETIDASINGWNISIDNTGIGIPQTNYITLAGSQLVSFTTNNPESTTNIAQATEWLRDNVTVQNLRDQYNADLVVCLTENAYTNNIGWASAIPATNTNYCAIIRAPFAGASAVYGFAHELGHLLGGRHEYSLDPGPPAYSHGYEFTGNSSNVYTTMMNSKYQGNYNRLLYFSTPNVSYDGVPIGTHGTNNVARVISENSVNIVNFRPSVTQSFNATIVGPTSISSPGYYNWELYTFCRKYITTTWQVSTDGFNYGSAIGSGDAVNYYDISDSNNGTMFLRCTIVTDQNQTYVTTTTINVNICTGCRLAPEVVLSNRIDQSVFSEIYPNPADKKITIGYSLAKKSNVSFELIDILGRTRMHQNVEEIAAGAHNHEVDTAELNNGLYICKVTIDGKVSTKPFVINK